MTPQCPNCQSESVVTRDLARKIAAFIGTLGGAARGYGGASVGAEIGSSWVSSPARPGLPWAALPGPF